MKHIVKISALAIAVGCVCLSANAAQESEGGYGPHYHMSPQEYQAANAPVQRGHWILRGGLGVIQPSPESNTLSGPVSPSPSLKAQTAYTGALSLTYMTPVGIGVELGTTLPVNIRTRIGGTSNPVGQGVGINSLRYSQTALTLQYYFAQGHDWHPYVGVGVAYNYFEPQLSTDTRAAGFSSSSTSQYTPVIQTGIDYYFSDNWLVNASLSYTRTDPRLRTRDTTGASRTYRYDFNPLIGRVNIGWRF